MTVEIAVRLPVSVSRDLQRPDQEPRSLLRGRASHRESARAAIRGRSPRSNADGILVTSCGPEVLCLQARRPVGRRNP